jgi:hypothetical protein
VRAELNAGERDFSVHPARVVYVFNAQIARAFSIL